MHLNAAEGNKEESYLHDAGLIVSQGQANFLKQHVKNKVKFFTEFSFY